jgi:hypothetical protein
MKTNYEIDKRESIYTGSTLHYDKKLYSLCQDSIVETNVVFTSTMGGSIQDTTTTQETKTTTKTEYQEPILCFAMDQHTRIVSLQNNHVLVNEKTTQILFSCLFSSHY